jgi:HTH-type transcriptional regulator/antitoxin HigA
MVRKGFFPEVNSVVEAKKNAETLLNELFSIFGESSAQHIYTRKSGQPTNAEALKAWQARVLQMVKGVDLPTFSANISQSSLVSELLSQSSKINPAGIKHTLNKMGIHFVVLPHLEHTYLDGATFLTNSGNPVIGITLRHDRLDNFWFTMFHELGHIFLHLSHEPALAFFDDTHSPEAQSGDFHEREANEFAQNAMIPNKIWSDFISTNQPYTETKVWVFARKLGISPAIPAGRLRYENHDYSGLNNLVGAHCLRDTFKDYVL